jgi:hypothetical protein
VLSGEQPTQEQAGVSPNIDAQYWGRRSFEVAEDPVRLAGKLQRSGDAIGIVGWVAGAIMALVGIVILVLATSQGEQHSLLGTGYSVAVGVEMILYAAAEVFVAYLCCLFFHWLAAVLRTLGRIEDTKS